MSLITPSKLYMLSRVAILPCKGIHYAISIHVLCCGGAYNYATTPPITNHKIFAKQDNVILPTYWQCC